MRKCSKSVHQSLTELNITPLLDLGFVLLVIFIITTTPIVNDLALDLPTASARPKDAPRKANYVTIDATGAMFLNTKVVNLEQLLNELIQLRAADPDLNVVVRSDGKTKYREVAKILAVLQQANVVKVDLATEAKTQPR